MAARGIPGIWVVIRFALVAVLIAVTLAGCNRKKPQGPKGQKPSAKGSEQEAAKVDDAVQKPPVGEARFHQSFAEATRAEPPADCRPPDMTATGKSTGKLYTEVKQQWDTILLVADDGKPLAYRAVVATKLGIIEIDLNPELAPNHVRNFIALARAGYYDGLVFERIVHQQSAVQPNGRFDSVEAGNPTGMDDAGLASFGSIGYWLKPEFDDKAVHEEGTVGALHGDEADTAACRFYITLCQAPHLTGNFTVFGKVSNGLDVVRRIHAQPVKLEEPDEDGYGRPLQPVVIEKVTVEVVK